MKVTIGHKESVHLIVLENIGKVFYERNFVRIVETTSETKATESWTYPYRVLNSINVVHDD